MTDARNASGPEVRETAPKLRTLALICTGAACVATLWEAAVPELELAHRPYLASPEELAIFTSRGAICGLCFFSPLLVWGWRRFLSTCASALLLWLSVLTIAAHHGLIRFFLLTVALPAALFLFLTSLLWRNHSLRSALSTVMVWLIGLSLAAGPGLAIDRTEEIFGKMLLRIVALLFVWVPVLGIESGRISRWLQFLRLIPKPGYVDGRMGSLRWLTLIGICVGAGLILLGIHNQRRLLMLSDISVARDVEGLVYALIAFAPVCARSFRDWATGAIGLIGLEVLDGLIPRDGPPSGRLFMLMMTFPFILSGIGGISDWTRRTIRLLALLAGLSALLKLAVDSNLSEGALVLALPLGGWIPVFVSDLLMTKPRAQQSAPHPFGNSRSLEAGRLISIASLHAAIVFVFVLAVTAPLVFLAAKHADQGEPRVFARPELLHVRGNAGFVMRSKEPVSEVSVEAVSAAMGPRAGWSQLGSALKWKGSAREAAEYCNRLSLLEALTPCYSINGDASHPSATCTGYRLPYEDEAPSDTPWSPPHTAYGGASHRSGTGYLWLVRSASSEENSLAALVRD